jgi:GDP-4-dehydro-6-deoxy-D-mannose reductase
MNKVLITGVNGFVGKHLSREFCGRGLEVLGLANQEPKPDKEIVGLLTDYTQCDITDKEQVSRLDIKDISCVVNLAGLAAVGPSFDNPELYMRVNVGVLSVLGEELFRQNPTARMIAVSSGALYDPNQEMPLTEKSRTIENSPYASSKLAMEEVASDFRGRGFDCITVRPFNHIGPGQGRGFLIPDMIEKLRNMDPLSSKITVGNIKTVRDYTDVRDIAKAYASLATAKNLHHNLYNVCSGVGLSGEDIIKALCSALGIDFDKLQLEVDQQLIRPNDPASIIGNSSSLQMDTGWSPTIPIDKTLADIIRGL